jgi:uncharacterized protein YfbU (UPF0304 family)
MTEEDEAFNEIEKSQGWRKRQIEMKEINDAFDEQYSIHKRNEVLEEVAKAVYNFKAFEKVTMDSFVAYIRSMKR